MKKSVLLTVTFLCILTTSFAQPGELDPTFGNRGIVKTDMGSHYDYSSTGRQVLIPSDGFLYILFNSPTFISKRFPDGSIDPAYGFNGYSKTLPFNDAFAALQPDGKIIIAGSGYGVTGFAVARITSQGIIDSTFGKNGIRAISFNPRSVAVQTDGKIVVAGGENGFVVARYNTDGIPDNTFNNTGQVIADFAFKIPSGMDNGDSVEFHSGTANTIALQPNGKIIVGGSAGTIPEGYAAFAIARYNLNGSLDTTFDNDGMQTTRIGPFDDIGYSLALQTDGRIVLAGHTNVGTKNKFAVVRYNINGSPDKTFNGNGKQTANVGSDMQIGNSAAIQSNGKIVVAGYTLNGVYNDFAVARFNTDGTRDKTFDNDGIATTGFIKSSDDYAGSVAIQTDGKIVVAGYSYTYSPVTVGHLAVVRYNTDGHLDNSFDNDGKLEGDYKQGHTSFTTTAIQTDGKIVAAGQTWNGRDYDFAVTRYNANGSPDNTFSKDGKQTTDFKGKDDYANSIAIQKNGKIVVAGNSSGQFAVARYNADGSPDNTFNGNGRLLISMGFSDVGRSVALQGDGKIVMAGYTFTDNNFNSSYFVIARFNTNGTPDITFSRDGKQLTDFGSQKNFAGAVAIQNDGKIIAAGYSYLDNHDNFSLARYNIDGSPDATFSHDGKQNNAFGEDDYFGQALAIQKDGKIVLAGFSQTSAGSSTSFAVARYKPNGDRDNTFGGDGFQTTSPGFNFNFGRSVAISNDGKIAVGGTFGGNNDNYAIVLYKPDGNPDSTFSGDGIQTTNIGTGGSSIQSLAFANNKLYAAGYGEFPGNSGIVARYLLNRNSNTPFIISLAAPVNHSTFPAHRNINVTTTISGANDKISKVAFFNGTILLHTSTEAPYSFKWKDVPAGSYILTATATDNNGLFARSAKVHIVVVTNKVPTVKIINPANNQTFLKGTTIHLQAIATDIDGSITKVEFYSGSILLTTEYKVPYTFNWIPGRPGNYTITARATDNWNGVTTSAAIVVLIVPNQPPVVSIISAGKTLTAPATINLEALAQDPDGRIIQVSFYNGTTLLTNEHKVPYTYQWQNVPAGTYTITAVAKDNWTAETTSSPMTITVKPPNTMRLSSRSSFASIKPGIDEPISIKLAPNPATNILNINATGLQLDKKTNLSVISSSGVVLKTIYSTGLTQTTPLNVSSLPAGVYTLKLVSGDMVMYKRFVKL